MLKLKLAVPVAAMAVLTALGASGCSAFTAVPAGAAANNIDPVSAAAPVSFAFTRRVQQYVVPAGVTSVAVTAAGGSSGSVPDFPEGQGAGAAVTGAVAVQPGQVLLVSVGEAGGDASLSISHDPLGGWGGLGANGGNGNEAYDGLRTSSAGGGATTVQLSNADGSGTQVILVAGGGGGGGGVSGDQMSFGIGGNAGSLDGGTPSWTGSDGEDGSYIKGGKGGSAGGQPGMAGARGTGGSGLGGNGGGGGGGTNGGNPGTGASGTSAGGGGGAGSSSTQDMTGMSVASSTSTGNGQVVLTPGS